MPKPHDVGSARRRRHGRTARKPWTGEASSQTRGKLALNRFSYSGGFDGYEGRMILKTESDEAHGPKGSNASP